MYLQQNFNKIQQKIVQILKDFTLQQPKALIKGFLRVWDTRIKIDHSDKTKVSQQNQFGEKVIQIILSLQVPASIVIEAVTEFIKES